MSKNQIPQSFIEELEVLAAMGKLCSVKFKSEGGRLTSMEAKISKVYEEEGQWYLLTDSAIRMSLQWIEEVDGMKKEHFC